MSALRDRCKGRWPSLLTMFRLDRRYLSGKHGPCPICNQGKDRFRFDDKDGLGTWICNFCGAGDGFALLMKIKGWDFAECATEIEAVVGKAEVTKPRASQDPKQLREAKNRLWQLARPVERGDPVAYYLECRGIELPSFPTCLRTVERCRYPGEVPQFFSAMLAMFQAPDGKPLQIHRTFLDGNGGKAQVEEPRLLMPGKMPEKGGAVRLFPAAPRMGVATGIETAFSAAILFDMPVWATLNDAFLMAWEPPEGVKELFIFGDNDRSFGGQSATFALAHRLMATKQRDVYPTIPEDPGLDWNDVLRGEYREAA